MKRDRMASVRLPHQLHAAARQCATADGLTFSEWARAALAAQVHQRALPAPPPSAGPVTGWQCPHVQVSGPPGRIAQPAPGCGCVMRPVYGQAAA